MWLTGGNMNALEFSITQLLDEQVGRRWSVAEIADRLTVTREQVRTALQNLMAQDRVVYDDSVPPVNLRL